MKLVSGLTADEMKQLSGLDDKKVIKGQIRSSKKHLTFNLKQTIFIIMPTKCHTADERLDLLDGTAKILLNLGASQDLTPVTHASSFIYPGVWGWI
jgi:hypothetical protein